MIQKIVEVFSISIFLVYTSSSFIFQFPSVGKKERLFDIVGPKHILFIRMTIMQSFKDTKLTDQTSCSASILFNQPESSLYEGGLNIWKLTIINFSIRCSSKRTVSVRSFSLHLFLIATKSRNFGLWFPES